MHARRNVLSCSSHLCPRNLPHFKEPRRVRCTLKKVSIPNCTAAFSKHCTFRLKMSGRLVPFVRALQGAKLRSLRVAQMMAQRASCRNLAFGGQLQNPVPVLLRYGFDTPPLRLYQKGVGAPSFALENSLRRAALPCVGRRKNRGIEHSVAFTDIFPNR